ncbi:MAG: hypothetical protein M3R06_01970 [Chloroflexota bacterium]|nr:hypothetical protein [Chloroflexota bacterium]
MSNESNLHPQPPSEGEISVPAAPRDAAAAPRPPRSSDERRGQGRPGEDRRRRVDRRRAMSFPDGLERAYCLRFRVAVPPDFPVQNRSGVATRRIMEVARREHAILFCDAAHDGEHAWPDGEPEVASL